MTFVTSILGFVLLVVEILFKVSLQWYCPSGHNCALYSIVAESTMHYTRWALYPCQVKDFPV